jgi:hypothetical protein
MVGMHAESQEKTDGGRGGQSLPRDAQVSVDHMETYRKLGLTKFRGTRFPRKSVATRTHEFPCDTLPTEIHRNTNTRISV